MTQTRVRLWTVNEYHRMFETGIITENQRVELIEGQVIPISAKNPPHAATTLCASDYLKRLLADSCSRSGTRSHSVKPIFGT
ncbi:hypothetical protein [Nostoc sp.]|uniref:hypothetical protein n=1 Tax=Nostoc sp. TaxID=1180 RepID=UPI002FFD2379